MKKIIQTLLISTSLILLAGCYQLNKPEEKKSVDQNEPKIVNEEKKTDNSGSSIDNKGDCEKAGGNWHPAVKPEAPGTCIMPYSDAGKKCIDSKDCQSGYCKAPKGTNPGSKASGECYDGKYATCGQEIKNGIASAEFCQ